MTKRVTQYAPHSSVVRSAASWPPQRVAELTHLYVVEGLTAEAIGLRMGLTKNTVIGKRTRLRLVRGDGFVPTPRQTRRLKGEEQRKPPSTLTSRLGALHWEMDAILAAPRPKPVAAYKATDNATRPFERRRSA